MNEIKKKIKSVSEKGDILLIVPPLGSINDVLLGPLILQAIARDNGYKTDVLHANLLLASVTGVDLYNQMFAVPMYWMLGERLFCRSAYGKPPLGHHPEYCIDEGLSTSGNPNQLKTSFNDNRVDLDTLHKAERMCFDFVEYFADAVASLDYKIVGCSAMMEQVTGSIALLNAIKERKPDTITIMGGGSCKEEMAEGTLSLSPALDYVFSGESELTFIDFLEKSSRNALPRRRTVIPGQPLDSMDCVPMPDYRVFFRQYIEFIGSEPPEYMKIWYETSRGCWWAEKSKCTFCSEYPEVYRKKPAERVLSELKQIKDMVPGRTVYMADSIMPRSYRQDFLPHIIGSREYPSLGYLIRPSMSLKDLASLRHANIIVLLPGVESLSTGLLKLMNKGVTGRQNLLFLRNSMCLGLFIHWLLLWGFPNDKREDYEEILRLLPLIRHFQPPRSVEAIVLMRFSPYYNQQEAHNITNVRRWKAVDMVFPPDADKDKLATYFSCEFPSEGREHPEIIREILTEIDQWKKTWRQTTLAMMPFMGSFLIRDNRHIHEKPKDHILDFHQAKTVMTAHIYDDSEILQWAVEEKLGVIMDGWYVPLIISSPDLLLQFENESGNGENLSLQANKPC